MYLLLNSNTISQSLIQAFSWMLIHSLWQGLLLSVMSAVVMLLTKKSKRGSKVQPGTCTVFTICWRLSVHFCLGVEQASAAKYGTVW